VERAPVARPADSTILERCFGPGWIAIGDAAVSYDPLASRGLVGALSSGLETPSLVAAPEARPDAWQAGLDASFATYRAERARLYV
jgi:flavin-dependent dehydrogenase